MQQPLAYIFQTLFQDEVFVITPTLNAGSRWHVMLRPTQTERDSATRREFSVFENK
jgi:hypothetical protein